MACTRGSFRSEFFDCLRRLAAPADVQTQYLRDLGVYPSADELALELHELVLLLRGKVMAGELSITEKAAVERLGRQFESFSGRRKGSLWTVDALASAGEWKEVRARASECLSVLNET